MMEGKPLPVYGDGSSIRDYTYIGDLVEGIRLAMDYNRTPFEVINLGCGRPVELMELIRTLEDLLGLKAKIDYLTPQPGDAPRTLADTRKAEELLGYNPKVPLKEGLKDFLSWLLR